VKSLNIWWLFVICLYIYQIFRLFTCFAPNRCRKHNIDFKQWSEDVERTYNEISYSYQNTNLQILVGEGPKGREYFPNIDKLLLQNSTIIFVFSLDFLASTFTIRCFRKISTMRTSLRIQIQPHFSCNGSYVVLNRMYVPSFVHYFCPFWSEILSR